mmetsp:Transcript_21534/g.53403  ORF Transcript_21534/g.53403 Transcript_21534/m.53403 type:complete len:253 (+) Transcript_21534:134-892(+)
MTRLLLALYAFACLAFVAEGRLLDPSSTQSDEASTDSFSDASPLNPLSIDTASSKFKNAFNTSKLELAGNSSMCEQIHPDDLPEECSCREPGPFSLVIECLKTFNSTFLNDTIGMKIDLDPCNEEGAKLSVDVTEKKHQIDYMLAGISAGESKNIPIPGLAMIVPGVGNVGLDVAVLIAGNPDMLRLKIGLNACAQLSTDHQMCASSIPGISSIFPWYILKGTYSFGDICTSMRERFGDKYNQTTATTVLTE